MKITLKHTLTALMLLCSAVAAAYDFEVDGIYYKILSKVDNTVEVYCGTYDGRYERRNTVITQRDTLCIPPVVVNNYGRTFTVTSIGSSAFMYMYAQNIKSITIPYTITNIDASAFTGLITLESIVVEDANSVYDSRENCNAIIETATNKLITGCHNTVIPGSVVSIEKGAFRSRKLKSVTIDSNLVSIGEGAFYGCTALEELYINDLDSWFNITFDSPESNPMYYAKRIYLNGEILTDVVVPSEITEIGEYSFWGCDSLKSVTIHKGVRSIGYSAFYECKALEEVYIEDLLSWCEIEFESADSNPLKYARNLYLNGKPVTKLVVPSGICSVKKYAFYNCASIEKLVIPYNIETIGKGAFYGCCNINSLLIQRGVTKIGATAFGGCSSIEKVLLPGNVSEIGYEAFLACTSLERINIPTELKAIPDGMLANCTSLKEIVIPDNVESIGKSVFAGCKSLNTVTISAQLSSIGENAFYGCSGIEKLRLSCKTPPSVGEGAFTNGQYEKTTLYVPKKAMSAYEASAAWNNFRNIETTGDYNWILYTILVICSVLFVYAYYSYNNKLLKNCLYCALGALLLLLVFNVGGDDDADKKVVVEEVAEKISDYQTSFVPLNSDNNKKKTKIYRHNFLNTQDVYIYLNGRRFVSDNGAEINFKESGRNLYINGKLIYTDVRIMEFSKNSALIRVSGPYSSSSFMLVLEDYSHYIYDVNDRTIYELKTKSSW